MGTLHGSTSTGSLQGSVSSLSPDSSSYQRTSPIPIPGRRDVPFIQNHPASSPLSSTNYDSLSDTEDSDDESYGDSLRTPEEIERIIHSGFVQASPSFVNAKPTYQLTARPKEPKKTAPTTNQRSTRSFKSCNPLSNQYWKGKTRIPSELLPLMFDESPPPTVPSWANSYHTKPRRIRRVLCYTSAHPLSTITSTKEWQPPYKKKRDPVEESKEKIRQLATSTTTPTNKYRRSF